MSLNSLFKKRTDTIKMQSAFETEEMLCFHFFRCCCYCCFYINKSSKRPVSNIELPPCRTNFGIKFDVGTTGARQLEFSSTRQLTLTGSVSCTALARHGFKRQCSFDYFAICTHAFQVYTQKQNGVAQKFRTDSTATPAVFKN